jgi:hypothetical protein
VGTLATGSPIRARTCVLFLAQTVRCRGASVGILQHWTLRWRKTDSNHRSLSDRIPLFRLVLPAGGVEEACSEKPPVLRGDRQFESTSLQRGVCCEPGICAPSPYDRTEGGGSNPNAEVCHTGVSISSPTNSLWLKGNSGSGGHPDRHRIRVIHRRRPRLEDEHPQLSEVLIPIARWRCRKPRSRGR